MLKTKSSAASINSSVATRLDEVAQLLEEQRANIFRVGAYRRGAAMLRELKRPIDEIVRTEGLAGLQELPGIGKTLARFIHQLVTTGRLPMLERLRGESDPIALLRTVPGIGKVIAERLHDELGIETLEELEIAAHDGRVARVLGFGEKRLAGIRDSLATRLGRVRAGSPMLLRSQPPVSEILDVDREYRRKSSQGVTCQDRAETIQYAAQEMATRIPHYPRRNTVHSVVLKYSKGAPTEENFGLGSDLLRRRWRRASVHRYHIGVWSARG